MKLAQKRRLLKDEKAIRLAQVREILKLEQAQAAKLQPKSWRRSQPLPTE